MKRFFIAIIALTLAIGPVHAVYAADAIPSELIPEYDPEKITYETQNNIIFRMNGNEGGGLACAARPVPPTSTKLDAGTLKNINDMKAIYIKAEQLYGVNWELIAALDYREDNNRDVSMLDGGPYGVKAVDSDFVPMDKLDSIKDAMIILKGKQEIYGVDPTKPMTFLQLQEAAVTYNRGWAYKWANQPPDTSPYVMNQFDAQHMNMTFPSIPHETLAGMVDHRYGAMTILANLVGAEDESAASGCIGGEVGAKVDYRPFYPKLPAGTLPESALCTPFPDRPDFRLMAGPPCVSFLAVAAAYKKQFGKTIPVGQGGGYRTAAQQIACGGTKQNPGGYNPNCIYYDPNNDPPEHLWGTAIDFSGPLTDKGTSEHQWLVANGPTYGWFWPNWASGGRGGNAGVEEDWHFAYYFAGHNPGSDKLESYWP